MKIGDNCINIIISLGFSHVKMCKYAPNSISKLLFLFLWFFLYHTSCYRQNNFTTDTHIKIKADERNNKNLQKLGNNQTRYLNSQWMQACTVLRVLPHESWCAALKSWRRWEFERQDMKNSEIRSSRAAESTWKGPRAMLFVRVRRLCALKLEITSSFMLLQIGSWQYCSLWC